MKKCLICSKNISYRHLRSKYCELCSFIANKLVSKLIGMKERCLNPNHKNFSRYKNFKIYPEWLKNSFSFIKFGFKKGYKPGLTIDRIDNNKGYFPKNCRFVTRSENMRNKIKKVTDWISRTRRCRVCKNIKKFEDFMISRKEIGGIAYECKICRKEIDRKNWLKGITTKQKKLHSQRTNSSRI